MSWVDQSGFGAARSDASILIVLRSATPAVNVRVRLMSWPMVCRKPPAGVIVLFHMIEFLGWMANWCDRAY
jgi:hypothetical protein